MGRALCTMTSPSDGAVHEAAARDRAILRWFALVQEPEELL